MSSRPRQHLTLALALALSPGCGVERTSPRAPPIPNEPSVEGSSAAPPPADGPAHAEGGAAPHAADGSPPTWDVSELRHRLAAHANPDPSYYLTDTPQARERNDEIEVFVISDMNSSYGSIEYRDEVAEAVATIIGEKPDLVLSTGDMVAGQRGGLDYHGMWRAFHAIVSDPLAEAGIPFAVTPGNHDASGHPPFAYERAIFASQWLERPPDLEWVDARSYPFHYSFVMGPAFFVSIDSTTGGPLEPEQMRWLDDQLARAQHHPVRVVFGHVPLYPFAQGKEDEIIGDPELEALLVRRRVDLFVSGHHHTYYPGRRPQLRLVSTSCLGQGQRRLLGDSELSPRTILELHIGADGIRSVDAYTGPVFEYVVPRHALPETIGVGPMQIVRDDL